jgi:hypothetical protein
MMVSLTDTEGESMKHILTGLVIAAPLLLAACSGMSPSDSSGAGTGGAGGTARTVSGADAANADVKGSTSATGATPANASGQR